jgi:hypothetical protein
VAPFAGARPDGIARARTLVGLRLSGKAWIREEIAAGIRVKVAEIKATRPLAAGKNGEPSPLP